MKFIASIFLFLVLLVPIEGISQASVKEMVETKQFVSSTVPDAAQRQYEDA
jgi:hypothetical protein